MKSAGKKPVFVRQVWADNLEFEILQINKAIPYYPLVSMDTEFPGTILEPKWEERYLYQVNPSLNYFLMKANVDALNIIQLGLTLSDYKGSMPSFGTEFSYVWEFNFCDFDIDRDLQNSQSINLLERQGIDFKKNKEKGINSWDFARLLLFNSGLISNRFSLTWITFQSAYDFGFLIKILTRQPLPCHIDTFMKHVVSYFGYNIYDMKYMMRFSHGLLCGGLEKVAELLNVERNVGKSHQAGSDSLLIMETFFKFTPMFCHPRSFKNMLYGLKA